MNRVHFLGFGILLSLLRRRHQCVRWAKVRLLGRSRRAASAAGGGGQTGGGTTSGAVSSFSGQKVRPLNEGPLHEAFLSPRKDRNPERVEKAPPPPLSERPGIEPPSASAEWIEGYWEWDAGRNDFVWVTGTWRVAPPGRFWVNGYWKRDDKGWYRVPGFWSERKTDRLDYRKNGPPQDRPDDDPGDPPNSDCFYVPGQYYPDGDGVVWKKGYWTKAQPGWSWVPAQWIRQPDGWVFQEGYWDRTLEDRGILFTPAEVDKTARGADDLTYQPYSKVSPEMYGQLNGAFGRPNSNYDGYPGVYYDDSGRYYGYGSYGYLNGYYGYLDYPYYGGYGYPYNATPVQYGMGGGGGSATAVLWRLWRLRRRYGGYGMYGGLLGGGFGLGVRRLWWLRRVWWFRRALRRLRLRLSMLWRLRRLWRIGLRGLWRIGLTAAMADSALAASGSVSASRLWLRLSGLVPVFGFGFGYGAAGVAGEAGAAGDGGWGMAWRRIRQSECIGQPKRQHHANDQCDPQRQHGHSQYDDQPQREREPLGERFARRSVACVVACVRQSVWIATRVSRRIDPEPGSQVSRASTLSSGGNSRQASYNGASSA